MVGESVRLAKVECTREKDAKSLEALAGRTAPPKYRTNRWFTLVVGMVQAVRGLVQDLLSCPVRSEPLGVDESGRRYWAFASDPGRLWVEAPAGAAWGWAAYMSAAAVKAVIGSLRAQSDLRHALELRLPLLTGMPDAAAVGGGGGGSEEELVADQELSSLKVSELRERLKERGLSMQGRHEQLVERLAHAMGGGSWLSSYLAISCNISQYLAISPH